MGKRVVNRKINHGLYCAKEYLRQLYRNIESKELEDRCKWQEQLRQLDMYETRLGYFRRERVALLAIWAQTGWQNTRQEWIDHWDYQIEHLMELIATLRHQLRQH